LRASTQGAEWHHMPAHEVQHGIACQHMMTQLDRPLIQVGSVRIPGKQHDRQERKPEDIIQEWLNDELNSLMVF